MVTSLSNIPHPGTVCCQTKEAVDVHQMVNNVASIKREKVEVALEWYTSQFQNSCHACGKSLVAYTIIGRGVSKTYTLFHFDCLEVEGQIVRREIKVKVSRRSRRYPDGIKRIDFIGTQSDLLNYVQVIHDAGYETIGMFEGNDHV